MWRAFYLTLYCCCCRYGDLQAWGFFGHGKINEIAVYSIPKPLFAFYKANVGYMRLHAADADKRRYTDTAEACRHFMDGDHYEKAAPFDTVPHYFSDALLKYGSDSIYKHGIVPWQVLRVYYRLIEAFKLKDKAGILRLSADLGHYVGDCHVPLHATSNYNGQKTGQRGVHALWESRLTELFFDDFDLLCGMAEFIENPNQAVWAAYGESYALVDSVLILGKIASKHLDINDKYAWEQRGQLLNRVYSFKFCVAYQNLLGDMIERRMRASVIMLSGLIYSAWIQAGQPVLDNMPLEEEPPKQFQKGQMIGREEED